MTVQRHAYPPGVVQERAGDQLDDRGGDRLGQILGDGRGRWSRDNYLVWTATAHEGRNDRTASTPRTTSPSA